LPAVAERETVPAYPLRLQKFLARAGVASRRGSEDLMSAGRVSVNGVVVRELGSRVDPVSDEVRVDGRLVRLGERHSYLILHKPAGYLTTMDDPHGRPIVRELVPAAEHPGLFPVGRLDFDTTGLLLFTTDGALAHRLLHPSRHVPKRYRAEVEGRLGEKEAAKLRAGVPLCDGVTKPAEVRVLALRETPVVTTAVEIALSEGRKHQVKRMLAYVGCPVVSLKRVAFGPLQLDRLPCGTWRSLDDAEIAALRAAAQECVKSLDLT
jgi:23S rRNA pseudouridine2605 synthase